MFSGPSRSKIRCQLMIWIHGGSFVAGTAGDPLFDGSKLSAGGGHRDHAELSAAGAFGWLAHPALAEGSSNSRVANYGMMDQIAALRWVHENIRAFGGDPNNVTLFRHLFGSNFGRVLMLCEQSRDLYQKAILESVPGRERECARWKWPRPLASSFSKLSGNDRNGPDPRAIDSKVILAAEKILLSKPSQSFGPTEDGILVKEDIAAGFGAGRQNRIPLIIGSNEDETGFGSEPDFNEELGLTGASVDELRRFYPEASRNLAELAARLYTDRVFTEPVRLVARRHAATGSPTFRYPFLLCARSPTSRQRRRSRTRASIHLWRRRRAQRRSVHASRPRSFKSSEGLLDQFCKNRRS